MGVFTFNIESNVGEALERVVEKLGEFQNMRWAVPAEQAGAAFDEIRAWLSQSLATAWDGEPPPPPIVPGPPLRAFLGSLATEQVNTLTVAEVGDVLFKESEGVQPGEAGAWQLEQGKLATADAIMNGDVRSGKRGPSTSKRRISARLMQTPEYQEVPADCGGGVLRSDDPRDRFG